MLHIYKQYNNTVLSFLEFKLKIYHISYEKKDIWKYYTASVCFSSYCCLTESYEEKPHKGKENQAPRYKISFKKSKHNPL